MIRLKKLPEGWREKVPDNHDVNAGTIKSKKPGKSKDNIKTQSYGSFEAILESTPNGTYRVKDVLK